MSDSEVITNPRHPVNCPHCTYLGEVGDYNTTWKAYRCGDLQTHWSGDSPYSRGRGIMLSSGPGYRGGADSFFALKLQSTLGDDYKDAYRLACRAGLVSKTLADRILQ